MTIQEKRNRLKDIADTLDPATLDRVYSFVIKINGNLDDNTSNENDTTSYRDATDKEVDSALDYIDAHFSKAMARLAQ